MNKPAFQMNLVSLWRQTLDSMAPNEKRARRRHKIPTQTVPSVRQGGIFGVTAAIFLVSRQRLVKTSILMGAMLAGTISGAFPAKANQALLDNIEKLRDTSAPTEKAQIRALTAKLANLHFSEAVNLNSAPEQTSETPRKVMTHRLRAIQLFEGFLKGENGRYEAPSGEQRAASMFNLARLYADTQKQDKAISLWKELSQNKDFPSIASESSLNLAELSEADNPASKDALTYYRNVIELDKRQDMRNYAHYRSAWIERNLEKWNDAIAELKEAMFDAKGQLKEEVVSDLLTFHAMSSIPADQALAYFQELGAKTGRTELPAKLADAYLATGKKAQAVAALQNVTTTKGSLIHSVKLLEEAYGLRDWTAYTKAADQIEKTKLEAANKEEQADIYKILKRLVVQLDAEKQTQADALPHFVTAAETFARYFPADQDIFRIVSSLVHAEKDEAGKARRIEGFVTNPALKISPKDQLVLREELVSTYQKLGKHEEAANAAKTIAATTTGADHRRFAFVQASELMDSGKDKDALPLFQALAKENPSDDFGLKSQMISTKILGKAGDYKAVLASNDAYLSSINGRADLKGTKEYQAIIEVRDRSEFEHAVSLGATAEALKSFQKFCFGAQFTPKSCENAESIAVKIGDYEALLSLLRFQKKNSEVTQILEASARFDDAAKDLEKGLAQKNKALTDYLHVAILYEISGNTSDRNRILSDMVTFIHARPFASNDEEALIFRTLDDAGQLKGNALTLKWSESRQCELLNRAVLAGDTAKKTVDSLMSCKTSPGAAWGQQATAKVEVLRKNQAKISFYGGNTKRKFEARLTAIKAMAKEIDHLLPAADSQTYISLAKTAQDAYTALAQEIENTPIPTEATEDMLPQIRASLAELAAPMKQKAEAYSAFVAKEEAANKDKSVATSVANQNKPLETVSNTDIASSVEILRKDPKNREALSQIRETFARKGNLRVAAYFDGRIKQTEARE